MVTWEALEAQCQQCRNCPLSESRRNVVFGVGNRQADVLFIGEGPGEQEDLRGEPFVGPAGQLLDVMLSVIDLDRSRVYIANIVKCRPPRNRDPLNLEQDACIGYLRAQTALIKPKIIVCLGRIAATRIIDPKFRITKQHGLWFDKAGVQITALYHPSALLRDPSKRPETFVDLKGWKRSSFCVRTVCTVPFESSKRHPRYRGEIPWCIHPVRRCPLLLWQEAPLFSEKITKK